MSDTLGRIGIVGQGSYVAGKIYEELDMMSYEGISYVASGLVCIRSETNL